jgi:hypothetical protein
MIYVPVNNNLCGSNSGDADRILAGLSSASRSRPWAAPGADHFGETGLER